MHLGEKSNRIVQAFKAQHDLALGPLPPLPCPHSLLSDPQECPAQSQIRAFAAIVPSAWNSSPSAFFKADSFCPSEPSLNATFSERSSLTTSSNAAAPSAMFHHTSSSHLAFIVHRAPSPIREFPSYCLYIVVAYPPVSVGPRTEAGRRTELLPHFGRAPPLPGDFLGYSGP